MMSTLDQPKVEVLARMARDINPEVEIAEFPDGVTEQNLDEFLRGADLFIDGFDFFVLDIRRQAFARCRELGIPAMTAAPVGMGVAFLLFTADGMPFEDYFRFEGRSELRQYINFLMGLAPSGMHRAYLADPTRLDIVRRKAPSTIIGVQLCASFTAAQTVKFLLGRGEVRPAPFHYHFDSYLNLFKTGKRRGNNGLLQRWKGDAIERALKKQLGSSRAELFPSTAGR
jgi:hypothetical protein